MFLQLFANQVLDRHVSQSGDAAGGRLNHRGSVVVVVTRGEHQISEYVD